MTILCQVLFYCTSKKGDIIYSEKVDNFIKDFKRVRVPSGKKYDFYFVNKKGVIISFKRDYPHVMQPKIGDKGYYEVGLRDKNSNRKFYHIHRIVAGTFIKNPNRRRYINHKDGNKLNNHVENLEWVTASENTLHAYEQGLITNNSKKCKLYYNDEKIEEFNSKENAARYVANKVGLSISHCRKCLSNWRETTNEELNNFELVILDNDYKPRGAIKQ